jgi:hypothetical protein
MILRHGNMFTELISDVILVTCNSWVKENGRVVMGRGAAKFMRDVFVGSDKEFGTLIIQHAVTIYARAMDYSLCYDCEGNQRPSTSVCPAYGVVYYKLPQEECSDLTLGLFQVKDLYYEPARPELIVSSVDILRELAKTIWKSKSISLNFPGIGNGKLKRKDVLPLLHRLPDNVTIWEL